MRRAAVALLGLLLLLMAPSLAAAARIQPRIVNGHSTAIAQAPFQVALYDPLALSPSEPENLRNAQFCGGVIRDAMHIVTAAHCVTFGGFEAAAPSEIEVFAGGEDLETPSGGEAIEDPVVATSFDPEYNPFTSEHDVGVLQLEKPLWSGSREIDGTHAIAPIAFAASPPFTGSEATVSGWGFTKALTPEQEPTETEEHEGNPPLLQSATVSIVARAQCSSDYETEGFEPFGEDLICAIGASTPTTDACFGDSGGPLFSGEPGSPADRLLGLVDFGLGCAQKEFPGVYQSLSEARNRAFASSDPPQAPLNSIRPAILGTLQAGQTVTCSPGSWLGAPEFFYRFYRDESTLLRPAVKALTARLTSSPSYTLQAADAGTRIFCQVLARNGGGIGEALGEDATIAPVTPLIPLPIVPPPTAVMTLPAPAAPTLRVLSARCRRGVCTVNVRAAKGASTAALVTKVEAKLSFTRRFTCRKRGRRATCKRTITRKLDARALPGEHFSIIATGLRPGGYTLTLVAIDTAGLRQIHATKLALLLKPAHRAA